MSVFLSVFLALLLSAAAMRDIQTHRIPNGLVAAGFTAGLAGHLWQGGGPGLLWSLAGMAAALPALAAYAVGALGAGDVKLLMAVGALMGPVFLLWTLLGTVFAGGLLALVWAVRIGIPALTRVSVSRISKAHRMPLAPAIALGALWAFLHLHGSLS